MKLYGFDATAPKTRMKELIYASEIELRLIEKYGCVVHFINHIGSWLSTAKRRDELNEEWNEMKADPDIVAILSNMPEVNEIMNNHNGECFEIGENERKCINFLVNYTTWP